MDFESSVSVNDEAVFDGKADLLKEIALIMMENGIDFKYTDDHIECLAPKSYHDKIMSIVRSRIGRSLIILTLLVQVIGEDDKIIFKKRNR